MTGFDLPGMGLVGLQGPGRDARGSGELEGAGGPEPTFAETLHRALRQVSDLQQDADDKALALARGEPVQVHEVLIAMGKSEIAFNLALEVRNRLLQAWETLARTAV
ncbi:MAG: flagellar hook-basal body complex protein FliE [Planctomycetota bacterium]